MSGFGGGDALLAVVGVAVADVFGECVPEGVPVEVNAPRTLSGSRPVGATRSSHARPLVAGARRSACRSARRVDLGVRRAAIAFGAVLGYAALFMGTWIVGIWQNQSPECDGVCVDMFPTVGALALLLGVLGALGGGFLAATIFDRRFANQRAKPS